MTARRLVAGGRGPCDCTNVTIMQLFHELKQQFPAVPDEVVSACITDHCHNRPACRARLQREVEQLPRALAYPPSLMGARMTESAHRLGNESARPSVFPGPQPIQQRTSTRTPDNELPPGKPPISPSSNKRFGSTKTTPTKTNKNQILSKLIEESHEFVIPNCKKIVSPSENCNNTNLGALKKTPAIRPVSLDLHKQTNHAPGSSVNLSVNVNCSVDVLTTPPRSRKHSSVLQMTPEPVWCQDTVTSPRSYTSVNLTLRTPTSEPLAPIDICSANSSLTYSTSSFDSRQGLQSRLQITVGPGGVGSVSAIRSRPRSSYHPEGASMDSAPIRAGSMPDLATVTTDTTNNVLLVNRQLERKEQLRTELEAGKDRLLNIKKEVLALRLENTPEYRERLRREIKHLQAQCDRLTQEVDRHSESRVPLGETSIEYYRHIFPGQRTILRPRQIQVETVIPQTESVESEEPRWPCHICTFRNHSLMNKCEQCEMPRILLVSAGPGDNIHIRFTPGNNRRFIHSWVV